MLSDGDILSACVSQVGSVTSTELRCSMFSKVENPTKARFIRCGVSRVWGAL